jgi:hypothetical protein
MDLHRTSSFAAEIECMVSHLTVTVIIRDHSDYECVRGDTVTSISSQRHHKIESDQASTMLSLSFLEPLHTTTLILV